MDINKFKDRISMSNSRLGRVLIRDAVPSLLGGFFAGDLIKRSQATIGGIWVGGKILLDEQGIRYFPAWWERIFHVNLTDKKVSFSEIFNIRVADENKTIGTVILGLASEDFVFQCYRADSMAGAIVEATKSRQT